MQKQVVKRVKEKERRERRESSRQCAVKTLQARAPKIPTLLKGKYGCKGVVGVGCVEWEGPCHGGLPPPPPPCPNKTKWGRGWEKGNWGWCVSRLRVSTNLSNLSLSLGNACRRPAWEEGQEQSHKCQLSRDPMEECAEGIMEVQQMGSSLVVPVTWGGRNVEGVWLVVGVQPRTNW